MKKPIMEDVNFAILLALNALDHSKLNVSTVDLEDY